MNTQSVDEATFEKFLKKILAHNYQRALGIFQNYGPHLSWYVFGIMCKAVVHRTIDKVLQELEERWEDSLRHENLKLVAQTIDQPGNKAQMVFVKIYVHHLCPGLLELFTRYTK